MQMAYVFPATLKTSEDCLPPPLIRQPAKTVGLIPGKVLKLLCCELAEPLNIIFQWFIAELTFPVAWKDAIVQPVVKGKGDKSTPTSYRPTNICATLGKMLERLIKEQLLKYC